MRTKTEVTEALKRWREFESMKHWRRTERGNLTRRYDGRRVTVFQQKDEFYGWCISSTVDDVEFCEGYDSEEDAMTGLGEALGLSD